MDALSVCGQVHILVVQVAHGVECAHGHLRVEGLWRYNAHLLVLGLREEGVLSEVVEQLALVVRVVP